MYAPITWTSSDSLVASVDSTGEISPHAGGSATKWQRLRAALIAGIDTAALAAADQKKAPPLMGRADAACGISFTEDSRWGASRLDVNGSIAQRIDLGATAEPLRSGDWWTQCIQERIRIFSEAISG